MNEKTDLNKNGFVAYEYTTVTVNREAQQMYIDCYKNFGWIPMEDWNVNLTDIGSVELKFKRDRRIKNRADVAALQKKCETALYTIDRLEKRKSSRAMGMSLGVGIVGTAFLAGSVFGFLAGNILLCVVLAIPGLAGWGLPYFLNNDVRKKETDRLNPLIDEQFDVVYKACEQANALMA